jgi:1,4-dihydroxy-2-naphthoate octaprenyltransferase
VTSGKKPSTGEKLKKYAAVARANFLLLPFTLVAVGAAAAAFDGYFNLLHTLLAAVGLVGLHVTVNALNEVSDFRRGIDLQTERTPFSGGSGTLPSGALQPRQGLAVAVVGAMVGLAVGVYFLGVVGWKLLPIYLLGAIATLGYTDFLARHYVGEFFAGLGLGALPVIGTALVQGGNLGSAAVAASLPAFFMTFNLLLLNEFPDEEADRTGGRRSLLLLLGRPAAARLCLLFGLLTPVSIVVAVALRHLPLMALFAILPSLLLLAPARWALTEPAEPVPIPALGANVAWNLSTNTVLAICLVVASG